jgi:hypothetical protein
MSVPALFTEEGKESASGLRTAKWLARGEKAHRRCASHHFGRGTKIKY